MATTSQQRKSWAPACTSKGAVFLAAYAALDAILKLHRYAPRAKDTGAFNCRRITGGVGWSLHAFGPGDPFTFWNGVRIGATSLALDLNWTTNPYDPTLITDMPRAMIDAILRIRTRNGVQVWGWGGDYSSNKDAMHFEIRCSPADLATGIDHTTVAGSTPPAKPRPAEWLPFRAGDTDASIARRGGLDNEVTEVQLILTHLAAEWSAPELNPGKVDGSHGPRSQAAVSAFKARIRKLQQQLGQQVWPNVDPKVGPNTIAVMRWWDR